MGWGACASYHTGGDCLKKPFEHVDEQNDGKQQKGASHCVITSAIQDPRNDSIPLVALIFSPL